MRIFFQRYLLPGLVFQSVIIGGGYGTGREISEFFLSHGALGGLFAMIVTAICWGLILALSFEFARLTKGYNYRTFFMALLGPFWRLFEIIYLLIVLLVLSVLGSAAGEMASAALGAPPLLGTLVLLGAIGILAYLGSKAIERVLAWWSVLLYAVYGVFFFWVATSFGASITGALAENEVTGMWAFDGIRYASYNLIALGAVLFVLPYLKTRRQALTSGFIAGIVGIVPGILVFMAMLTQYPAILKEPVPILSILQGLNSIWFFVVFQIVLFGTFIETGVGIVHAINERVANVFLQKGKVFPHWARLAMATGLLACAIFLADAVGIINLVAKGYGTLSYAFIAVVIIPLLTVGIFKIVTAKSEIVEA